jgi:hypothetical protein
MTDLNELLKDWKSKRLAYNEISRNSLEALFTGIVDELEALKGTKVPDPETLPQAAVDRIVADALAERAGYYNEMAALNNLSKSARLITDLPPETVAAMEAAGPDRVVEVDAAMRPVKRGPGRPKAEAA